MKLLCVVLLSITALSTFGCGQRGNVAVTPPPAMTAEQAKSYDEQMMADQAAQAAAEKDRLKGN